MTILDDLSKIKAKKKVITSIEYNCKNEDQEEEVLETVKDILLNNLNSFSKITYDVVPSDHTVKVEVSQNA